jgi:predicted metal-dependent phosphotriesterase family hydrolase
VTTVPTATGESIAVGDLGRTLPHEHLFINMMRERRGDGLVTDEALLVDELSVFARQGGGTIWDLTSAELTPGSTSDADPRFTATHPGQTRAAENVAALARVSRATGVHVVLGTGHYRDPYIDRAHFDRLTVDQIAADLVRDLTDGIPGTDARAGVIGEIGADQWFVSATEERSFRAAARASKITNAILYTHAARWPVGHAQLDILFHEGVDPSRVVIGHVDTVTDPGYATSLLDRGVAVGFDTINTAAPAAIGFRVAEITKLVRSGFVDRILVSHDVCLTSHLRAFGGNGFGYLLGGFRDALREADVTDEEYDLMTITTPARLLAGT